MTELINAAEFYAGKDTAKQYLYFYSLQKEIEKLTAELEEKTNILRAGMECLAGIQDNVFSVADLRPVRTPDLEYIRENMPEVYADCLTISNTEIGRIMSEHYTRRDLETFLRGIEPELFEERAKILMSDLDRALGGKKAAKEWEGRAYHTEWKASPKTRIVVKNPEAFPELAEGEE